MKLNNFFSDYFPVVERCGLESFSSENLSCCYLLLKFKTNLKPQSKSESFRDASESQS